MSTVDKTPTTIVIEVDTQVHPAETFDLAMRALIADFLIAYGATKEYVALTNQDYYLHDVISDLRESLGLYEMGFEED